MAAIDLVDVGVDYPIYSAEGRSVKTALLRTVGGNISGSSDSRIVIEALRGINISLRPGDRLALLGGNGAGKSTLLRVLAGIMEPPIGTASIRGQVSALIDLSMGMEPEATGYENIRLRSTFLGASFAKAQTLIPEIAEFSGLGDYLSFPLRTYSSGMAVRLSFATSTVLVPEILVMDEHVGAADAAFAAKAKARIKELTNQAQIVVFATHSMEAALDLCTRGIVMSNGRVVCAGSIQEAIDHYTKTEPQ